MIAEVMRANGAEMYQSEVIEKELPRLNRLAAPCVNSREDPPAASKPADEKFGEVTTDIKAKISAQFLEQMKALSATSREEVNENVKKLREDINRVRDAVLEKVTDVFHPDALKSNHRLKNLDYRTSDRASQTTMDASWQLDKAQPQDDLLCESQGHQPPHTSVQQNLVPEQYSAIRSVKEPQSTVKEDGPASPRQISPRDRNIDSARRTPTLPHGQDMVVVKQSPTTYPHGEKSQRKHPIPSEQVTDSAKKQNDTIVCRKCSKSFAHKGALHDHLRSGSHYGPFPALPSGTESTGAAATEASTKPRIKDQREIKPESQGYPSSYRPNKSTEWDRGPSQWDGTRDTVGFYPDPAAQLLPPETSSAALVNRVSHGHTCQVCYKSFEIKQQLQSHLRDEGHLRIRGDQAWLPMPPNGPRKAKKVNQTGSEKKSQVARR